MRYSVNGASVKYANQTFAKEVELIVSINNDRDSVTNCVFRIPEDWSPNWTDFEDFLEGTLRLRNFTVTYEDGDQDQVHIESDEELDAALKVATEFGNKLHLHIQCPMLASGMAPINKDIAQLASELDNFEIVDKEEAAAYKTVKVGSCGDADDKRTVNDVRHCAGAACSGDDTQLLDEQSPPPWFTAYMEKFKEDVVSDIVKKVSHRLQKRLAAGEIVLPINDKLEGEEKPGKRKGCKSKSIKKKKKKRNGRGHR